MNAEMLEFFGSIQVIAGVAITVGVIVAAVLLNAVFRYLVNRFGARADDYPHRTGTQLPREPK